MFSRRTILTLLAVSAASACARKPNPRPSPPEHPLVAAARRQIGVTTGFDTRYRVLDYPNGDPPRVTGVCADVIVRAARDAYGLDLQRLVHEDMARAFAAYPRRWGLKAPDSNIDHRRVPNLETWWQRHGALLALAEAGAGGASFPLPLRPGDLLTWRCFPSGGPHVAIVSQIGPVPRIIQNNGGGVREEPLAVMHLDRPHGHYRWAATG